MKEIFYNLAVITDQDTFPEIEWAFGCTAPRELQGNPPGPRVLIIQQPMFRSLACVCRSWYATATERLYRDIYISSYSALGLLVKALSNPKHNHLLPLVHTFMMANDIFHRHYVGYTQKDMENLGMIYRLCPNLHAVKFVPPNIEEVEVPLPSLSQEGCSSITRLEMPLPRSTGNSGNIALLGPITKLPSLQELFLYADTSTSNDHDAGAGRADIKFPLMPQLRRLSISKWHTNKQTIEALSCPLLHALELIDCTFYPNDLFAIFPYRFSSSERLLLESMVITGLIGAGHSEFHLSLYNGYPKLSYLCIPIELFVYDGYGRPPTLPPSLQHLILTDEKSEMGEMAWVESYLVKVLEFAAESTPCHLKHVQIITSSPFTWKHAEEVAKAAKIKYDVLMYSPQATSG